LHQVTSIKAIQQCALQDQNDRLEFEAFSLFPQEEQLIPGWWFSEEDCLTWKSKHQEGDDAKQSPSVKLPLSLCSF